MLKFICENLSKIKITSITKELKGIFCLVPIAVFGDGFVKSSNFLQFSFVPELGFDLSFFLKSVYKIVVFPSTLCHEFAEDAVFSVLF